MITQQQVDVLQCDGCSAKTVTTGTALPIGWRHLFIKRDQTIATDLCPNCVEWLKEQIAGVRRCTCGHLSSAHAGSDGSGCCNVRNHNPSTHEDNPCSCKRFRLA